MGFSRFYGRVFDRKALIRIRLGGIFGLGEGRDRGMFVRIRIYGIMGFSGFYRRVFNWQATIRIRISWIFGLGEGRDRGMFVRIRIYWIIRFSGFYRRVFDRKALIRIRLGGILGYGEGRELGKNEILKIPSILILTKPRNRRPQRETDGRREPSSPRSRPSVRGL